MSQSQPQFILHIPSACVHARCLQSCPTFCDPMDHNPSGSSVLGILQARILEWVAISFSRGSSWPSDWTWVSRTAGRLFTVGVTREFAFCLPSSNVSTSPLALWWIHFLPLAALACPVILPSAPLYQHPGIPFLSLCTPADNTRCLDELLSLPHRSHVASLERSPSDTWVRPTALTAPWPELSWPLKRSSQFWPLCLYVEGIACFSHV